MKGPKDAAELTELYHSQAFMYWSVSGTSEHEPPPYVVMCAVNRFQVWRPGYAESRTRHSARLLAGFEPEFDIRRAELTKGAVGLVTSVFGELEARKQTPSWRARSTTTPSSRSTSPRS